MSTPQVRRIVLTTNNILEMEELIRKAGQTTTEELRGSIKTTLNNWNGCKDDAQKGEILKIQRSINNQPSEDGSWTKTTVKLFLSNNESSQVEDAIKTVITGLQLPRIDTVIVTPPDISDDATLQYLEPVWRALEKAVANGTVVDIGLADVSARLFMELYEWAEVKPSTIQVSLSSCCMVPQELNSFAQQHDVQVLTHSDPADEPLRLLTTSKTGTKENPVDDLGGKKENYIFFLKRTKEIRYPVWTREQSLLKRNCGRRHCLNYYQSTWIIWRPVSN